jgi:hypothetical protein
MSILLFVMIALWSLMLASTTDMPSSAADRRRAGGANSRVILIASVSHRASRDAAWRSAHHSEALYRQSRRFT